MGGRIVKIMISSLAVSLGLSTGIMAQAVAAVPTGVKMVSVHADATPLKNVLQQIARQAGLTAIYSGQVSASAKRVTLHLQDVPVVDAFEKALSGTELKATIVADNVIFGTAVAAVHVQRQGGISGKVTDAANKQPLRGITVQLDDGMQRGLTEDDGTFHLANVSVGAHRISVRLIGYGKVVKAVNVSDGTTTTVDFTLTPSANTLDQVVVTGTVVQTELKAVPNAITVITAKQIEEREITKIDQLFHGDVPGVFAQNLGSGALLEEVTMFSRGTTKLPGFVEDVNITNPIKTYVDGIELADPKYLSQIDPKSIERIEILTGPQASTVYGSNAINGVMQIFTKRGTGNTPQLMLNLLSGWVENNFSSARTPWHDYSVQLNGIEGRLAYNAGGSWNYMGPWTPAKQTVRTGAFGGMRLETTTTAGRITADVTLRRAFTQNRQHGNDQQAITDYRERGWYTASSTVGLSRPTTSTLMGQTMGFTLGYVPTHWWSQEFRIGQDISTTETRFTVPGYRTVSDTLLILAQNFADRHSLSYTTTVQLPVVSFAQAVVTAGADAWQNLATSWSVVPTSLTGTLTGQTDVSRQPGHNTGSFLQTQLEVKDQFFLTYGLRAEWNPNFGDHLRPSYAPRYGVAYTRDFGELTAKVRASYGRATRPPESGLKTGCCQIDPGSAIYWGTGLFGMVGNPDLGPESQKGGEGGLELYMGRRGSLTATWYNQTVDGLIANVAIDSVDLLPEWQAVFGSGKYFYHIFQNLNLGSIRNNGLEFHGSIAVGPLTAEGTYSWTRSRTIGITPRYRSFFTPASYLQYQPGASFRYLPEHTWAAAVRYDDPMTTIAVNITGTGAYLNNQDDLYLRSMASSIRLLQNKALMNTSEYVNTSRGYALADLMIAHRLSSQTETTVRIQNLTNRYRNDFDMSYATLGRQTSIGLRIRL